MFRYLVASLQLLVHIDLDVPVLEASLHLSAHTKLDVPVFSGQFTVT